MKKPGYKTAAFWATAATMVIAALTASGVAGDAMEPGIVGKGIALGASLMLALGYTIKRGIIKRGDESKPGWKQTEFWLSLAAVVMSTLMASGALGVDGTAAKIIGAISGVLALMGYGRAQSMSSGPVPRWVEGEGE